MIRRFNLLIPALSSVFCFIQCDQIFAAAKPVPTEVVKRKGMASSDDGGATKRRRPELIAGCTRDYHHLASRYGITRPTRTPTAVGEAKIERAAEGAAENTGDGKTEKKAPADTLARVPVTQPDWLPLIDEIIRTDLFFRSETFCYSTAQRLVQILTNNNKISCFGDSPGANFKIDMIYKGDAKSMDEINKIPEMVDFFKNVSSSKPQTNLYFFGLEGHGFIVQKYSDSNGSWWRTYESWAGTYSQINWLSSKPITIDRTGAEEADANIDKFESIARSNQMQWGQGKLLNREQIGNFLQEHLDYCFSTRFCTSNKSMRFKIRRFDLEIESLKKRLVQQLHDAKLSLENYEKNTGSGYSWYCSSKRYKMFAGI